LELKAKNSDLVGAAVLVDQLSEQLRRVLAEFEAFTRKVSS
jgi:hypothetical protein